MNASIKAFWVSSNFIKVVSFLNKSIPNDVKLGLVLIGNPAISSKLSGVPFCAVNTIANKLSPFSRVNEHFKLIPLLYAFAVMLSLIWTSLVAIAYDL